MLRNKLTPEILAKMIKLRETAGLTYYALSIRFGIPESTIEKKLAHSKKNEDYVSPDCR